MNYSLQHEAACCALPSSNRPRRLRGTIALVAALSATLFSAVAFTEEDPAAGGDGPGPAANAPGPGCNVIPPLASTGTKVDISQFPAADSLTDPELAGPVQLLRRQSVSA